MEISLGGQGRQGGLDEQGTRWTTLMRVLYSLSAMTKFLTFNNVTVVICAFLKAIGAKIFS